MAKAFQRQHGQRVGKVPLWHRIGSQYNGATGITLPGVTISTGKTP